MATADNAELLAMSGRYQQARGCAPHREGKVQRGGTNERDVYQATNILEQTKAVRTPFRYPQRTPLPYGR
jgi:hypothetical protein